MTTTLHEDHLAGALIRGSVLLLLVCSLSGLMLFSTKTGLGVLTGGIIGIANFLWMRSTLRRILGILPDNPGRYALLRFVARMAVLALVLYLVLVSGFCSPIALVAGLSVIVVTIVVLSLYDALHREA